MNPKNEFPETTMIQYVERAMRTDAPLTAELVHRLTDPKVIRLLHAAMGLVTEAGELTDMLKKHIFSNRPLDLVNAKEELGDGMWYTALAIDVLQTTMADIMTMNIEKLRLRYPEKFEEAQSNGRNVKAEREFLEQAHQALAEPDSYQLGAIAIHHDELSQRGEDWVKFALQVLNHIETYTVPQYGDKGQDRASGYNMKTIADHIDRYRARMGSNARGPTEAVRDLIKIAHYACLGWERLMEESNAID